MPEPVGVVSSVRRKELVGPVHTTSTVTPSTMSSSKVMEQVRAMLEPLNVEEEDEYTSTREGRTTKLSVKKVECKKSNISQLGTVFQ